MWEPSLLTLLDEGTVPPWALRVFGRVGLDDYIFDEREVDITLSVVWEEGTDSNSYRLVSHLRLKCEIEGSGTHFWLDQTRQAHRRCRQTGH